MSEKYIQRVRHYYQDYRPAATRTLGTPAQTEDFFRSLAIQIEDQVQDAESEIAGPDLAEETYLGKMGRLNMARLQAEELVLAELLYASPPEATDSHEESTPRARELLRISQELAAERTALNADLDREWATETAAEQSRQPRA